MRTLSLVMVLLALATGSRAAWINMDQLLLRDDTGNSWLAKAGKFWKKKGMIMPILLFIWRDPFRY